MDVMKLEFDTYLPVLVVSGYSSMIWTERFKGAGEFEMVTPDILKMRNLIPEGSLITLLETNEVMIVETYDIKKDDDGNVSAVIKGRSFDTILEDRVWYSKEPSGKFRYPGQVIGGYTRDEAIFAWIWNVISNSYLSSSGDILVHSTPNSIVGVLPNVSLSDATYSTGGRFTYFFETGEIYSRLTKFLAGNRFGIRGVRPNDEPTTLISFGKFGDIIRNTGAVTNDMRLELYQGYDRSINQSSRDRVIFSYDAGDIDNPKYLISNKNFANIIILSSTRDTRTYYGSGDNDIRGLDRREKFIDMGDFGFEGTTWETITQSAYNDLMDDRGAEELADRKKTVFMEFTVSPNAKHVYGVDYFLGDRVTVNAEYDFQERMYVTEYIRTEDESGDFGYPSLKANL